MGGVFAKVNKVQRLRLREAQSYLDKAANIVSFVKDEVVFLAETCLKTAAMDASESGRLYSVGRLDRLESRIPGHSAGKRIN